MPAGARQEEEGADSAEDGEEERMSYDGGENTRSEGMEEDDEAGEKELESEQEGKDAGEADEEEEEEQVSEGEEEEDGEEDGAEAGEDMDEDKSDDGEMQKTTPKLPQAFTKRAFQAHKTVTEDDSADQRDSLENAQGSATDSLERRASTGADSSAHAPIDTVEEDTIVLDECPRDIVCDTSEGGKFTLLRVGTVVWDLVKYHDGEFVYPVGFTGRRKFACLAQQDGVEDYLFEIRYGGAMDGPIFIVKQDCEGGKQFSGVSPSAAWRALLTARVDAGLPDVAEIDGWTLFGLRNEEVKAYLQNLPNTRKCYLLGKDKKEQHYIGSSCFVRTLPSAMSKKLSEAEKQAEREERRKKLEDDRKRKKEEQEMEKIKRQQELKQQAELRRQKQLEMQQKREEEKEKQRQEKEKSRLELERVIEEKRKETEKRQEEILKQQESARNLMKRRCTVEDLELLSFFGKTVSHDPKDLANEPYLVNPTMVNKTIPSKVVSNIIEVWDFVNMFSDVLGCKKLKWKQLEREIVNPDCALLQGLHVLLLENLLGGMAKRGGDILKGRPLNSLTWPVLMRDYLSSKSEKDQDPGLKERFAHVLNAQTYESTPLEARMLLLSYTVQCLKETDVIRQHVDKLSDAHAALLAEKHEQLAKRLEAGESESSTPVHMSSTIEVKRPVTTVKGMSDVAIRTEDVGRDEDVEGGKDEEMEDVNTSLDNDPGSDGEGGRAEAQDSEQDADEGEGGALVQTDGADIECVCVLRTQGRGAAERSEALVSLCHRGSAQRATVRACKASAPRASRALLGQQWVACSESDDDDVMQGLPQVDGAEGGGDRSGGKAMLPSLSPMPAMQAKQQLPSVHQQYQQHQQQTMHFKREMSPLGTVHRGLYRAVSPPRGGGGGVGGGAFRSPQQGGEHRDGVGASRGQLSSPKGREYNMGPSPQRGGDFRGAGGGSGVGGGGRAGFGGVGGAVQSRNGQGMRSPGVSQMQQQQRYHDDERYSEEPPPPHHHHHKNGGGSFSRSSAPTSSRNPAYGGQGSSSSMPGIDRVQTEVQAQAQELLKLQKIQQQQLEEMRKLRRLQEQQAKEMAMQQRSLQQNMERNVSPFERPNQQAFRPQIPAKPVKDPNAPKRPRTGFFLYSMEIRDEVKMEHPDLSFGDLSKLIGKQWNEMDSEEKRPYLEREAEDKARYHQEMNEYNGLSPDAPKKRSHKRKPQPTSSSPVNMHRDDMQDSDGDEDAPPSPLDHVESTTSGKSPVPEPPRHTKAGGASGTYKRARELALVKRPARTTAKKSKSGAGGSLVRTDDEEVVEWAECEECGCWRFFPQGLESIPDGFNCADGGKMCNQLDEAEQFLVDWISVLDEDDKDSQVYRFILENREFSVHDLYWSVMSFGGMQNITKWKDIANDMLFRKCGETIDATPGKNFGLIRNQWERWRLAEYHEAFGHRPIPPEYVNPSVKKTKAQYDLKSLVHQMSKPGSSSSRDSPIAAQRSSPHDTAHAISRKDGISPPAKTTPAASAMLAPVSTGSGAGGWSGRKMWSRGGGSEPSTAAADGAKTHVHAPSSHRESPGATRLTELTAEEKKLVKMLEASSFKRGVMRLQAKLEKEIDAVFYDRVEQAKSQSEPLGLDRYKRKYWVVAGDYSKLWVEKPTGDGSSVVWGYYDDVDQVKALYKLLDVHGEREMRLKDSLDLVMPRMQAAMNAQHEMEIDEGGEEAVLSYHKSIVLQAASHASNLPNVADFSQALYKPSEDDQIKKKQDEFGILPEDCSEEQAKMRLPAGLGAVKGALLGIEMALRKVGGQDVYKEEFARRLAQWRKQLHAAIDVDVLSQTLQMLIDGLDRSRVSEAYTHTLTTLERDTSPATVSSLAMRVFGLDAALVYTR